MIVGLAPYIVNFLMLPVYTRFMGPAAYGIVALVNAFAAFLSPLMGLKLGSSLGRYYFDYDEQGIKIYFSTILYGMLIFNILLLAILLPLGEAIAGMIFQESPISFYPYIFLGVMTVLFSELAAYFTLFLRVQEKGGVIMAIALAGVVINILLGLYFVVYRQMEALGMLLATALGFTANTGLLLLAVRRNIVASFQPDLVRKALAFGLPIIPHSLGRVIYSFSDRIILGFFVPVSSIGLYNIGDRVAGLMGVTANSFDGAFQPTFMRESVRNKKAAAEMTKAVMTKWLGIMMVLYLALALFSEEIITILTPPSYHSASRFVPILAGAFVFRSFYNFAANTVVFEKKTYVIPMITFSAGLFNVLANLLLIPRFGIMAAAWTTLLSFAMTFALALYFSNRIYPLQYEWGKLAGMSGLAVSAFIITSAVHTGNPWADAAVKAAAVMAVGHLLLRWNGESVASVTRQAWRSTVSQVRER